MKGYAYLAIDRQLHKVNGQVLVNHDFTGN